MADVSGKGIAAALLMAKLSAETRFSLASEETYAAAFGRLNGVFCGSAWEDRFVTMVLCVLDPARHEVTIVNAGHMPPLLRRTSGNVEALGESEIRLPLGVKEDVDYPQFTASLQPGDCLTLYTDGITDAMNVADEFFGGRRLLARLADAVPGAATIGQAILDEVKLFVGTQAQVDDMCLACFGRQAEQLSLVEAAGEA